MIKNPLSASKEDFLYSNLCQKLKAVVDGTLFRIVKKIPLFEKLSHAVAVISAFGIKPKIFGVAVFKGLCKRNEGL